MQDCNIIKACNFYVSEWHLFAALLPYLRDELKMNNKVFFISQDKIEKGLKELVHKINVRFENDNGINDIKWLDANFTTEIEGEYKKTTIIVQGTYKFINEVNSKLDKILKRIYKECVIINCYEVFDSNNMLHNILEEHDLVFNTGGLHKKEEIFQDYKDGVMADSL